MSEPLLWLVATLFVAGPIGMAVAAAISALRSRSLGWVALLGPSVATVPWVPGIPVPSGASTRIFESPDLVSGEARSTVAGPSETRLFGRVRIESEREVQGDRWIAETRRTVLVVPVLPLLLGAGWFGTRRTAEEA